MQGGSRPPTLPLACFPAPIPPAPFPSGEGGELKFSYARGFAPCIPAPEPGRHWGRGRIVHPAEGVRSLSPAAPAFSLLSCLHPPTPFPAGRGRIIVFLCKGLRPLHPQGWAGRGTCTTKGFCLFTGGGSAGSQGEGGPGEMELSVADATAAFEMVLSPGAGRESAARVQPQGCRGRSPRRNKLIVSPFPAGEGGWGDRGQKQS